MFPKLFVVLVSALVLCPQLYASTFTFTTPAGGKIWRPTDTVNAQGATNVPGGDKIKVSFGYGIRRREVIENSVKHTVTGTVSGPNMWIVAIVLPASGSWRKSPVIAKGPPVVIKKDAFVKIEDLPAVAGSERYRNDQGVK